MNKVFIRSWLFVLVAGMLLSIFGCNNLDYGENPRKPYISEPAETNASTPFLVKAKEWRYPSDPKHPTPGETYLITELGPFLCEILKSDDIEKTLASMGEYKNTPGRMYDFEFITKNFAGGVYQDHKKNNVGLWVKPAHENSWPFTDREFIGWMQSIGLDVVRDNYREDYVGVAGIKYPEKNRHEHFNYTYKIRTSRRNEVFHPNQYDTASLTQDKKIIRVSWRIYPKENNLFCH